MQALISGQQLTKSLGGKLLFEGLSIVIGEGERLALIGPNGSGKSTLMKMLIGKEDLHEGNVAVRRGLRIGYVPQQPELNGESTIDELLLAASRRGPGMEYEQDAARYQIIDSIGFTQTEKKIKELSGGWKKRVAIAAAMLEVPDLLLLDEPTNHLDIDGILWLEETLMELSSALCFVSHDRYFIEKLATRVIEIDKKFPSGTFSTNGAYGDFLIARDDFLSQLDRTQKTMANKVRREVEWLRQGAKARTTKSKHRSDEAHKMVEALNKMTVDNSSARITFSTSNRGTKELIVFDRVSKDLGGKSLFKNLDLYITPGTRLGVVGPNGSGKTTLIKTLLGELPPDKGIIRRAPQLKVAFFDQERKQLNPDQKLKHALCNEGGAVVVDGKEMHMISWAKKFLFRPDQLDLPLKMLSGGEQARVLLSKLVLEKADILFFDEPTNDLDIQTLEVLEESFVHFPGAIVIVTHDRYFMDRVSTSLVGLGGAGDTVSFADYTQWEVSRGETQKTKSAEVPSASTEKPILESTKQHISSVERKRSLQNIEKKIEKEEKKLAELKSKFEDPAIAADHQKLAEYTAGIKAQEVLLHELLMQWESLA